MKKTAITSTATHFVIVGGCTLVVKFSMYGTGCTARVQHDLSPTAERSRCSWTAQWLITQNTPTIVLGAIFDSQRGYTVAVLSMKFEDF